MPDESLLDNPAWHSLTGPHQHLAEVRGAARRYAPDASFASAVERPWDPQDPGWADLAALAGAGELVTMTGAAVRPPEGWERIEGGFGVQLVDIAVDARRDDEAVRLGPADVPEILDLVARTKPGPFLPRTIELGTYVGLRRDGALVALAGERMHPLGWTEISAVCTDERFRGQGLATRLVLDVTHRIRQRGDHPLLHAAETNTNAIRLYEAVGFKTRIRTTFVLLRTPLTDRNDA
ncbi:GNAT family N-acetyltransferase [Nocardioides sp. Kera G14]|uniref:GNAT family N-acetyltransferase n=1 Tax=Nocardioides sp. Kera G14 TaxID=2884264 RepID=UPI001D123132|nr:GNAT family N-acetyltransferase [Nocardioides sp. Kera G14]UDY24389.1 GNAT family N-acetyltransferase [Nocardioides sp. Kera G14]